MADAETAPDGGPEAAFVLDDVELTLEVLLEPKPKPDPRPIPAPPLPPPAPPSLLGEYRSRT